MCKIVKTCVISQNLYTQLLHKNIKCFNFAVLLHCDIVYSFPTQTPNDVKQKQQKNVKHQICEAFNM